MKYKITPCEIEDLAGVISLLRQNDLPASDLISSQVRLLVAKSQEDQVLGCIGLEVYDQDGFLRSMAVDKDHRNQGIAKSLMDALIIQSKSLNIHTMHLLTTSAANYFEKQGYAITVRDKAPDRIKANARFTTLCSSTARYMVKAI